MKATFYRMLIALSKLLGDWFFVLVAQGVAAGYFLMSPTRRAVGVRFYAALFPDDSHWRHLRCTWKQFRNFTRLFLERTALRDPDQLRFTMDGWEHLKFVLEQGRGGILLMSHVGNWEVAAHLLKRRLPDLRLMLYMGERRKAEIESLQKIGLSRSGIQIHGVDENGGSPLDIVEGIRFLKSGSLVSMAGDVVWHPSQRTVDGVLLGHRVRIPEAPYMLSYVSGAPLILFFAFRTGSRRYHFTAGEPILVKAACRSDREKSVRATAQQYLDALEHAVRQHPMEWYHFEAFLGPPIRRPNGEFLPSPADGA